jgi:hypothetical protein
MRLRSAFTCVASFAAWALPFGSATAAPAADAGTQANKSDVILLQTSADLDGDGRPEQIALTTQDALTSGGDTAYANQPDALTIEPGYFGAVRVSVIEIDHKRHALLVRTNGGSGEDPPFDATLVFYRRHALTHRSLADREHPWATITAITSNGKSQLTVRYAYCPAETTVRYRVHGDALREIGRRTVKLHSVDECSG